MQAEITKSIRYNRENRDFDCFVTIDDQEQYIGSTGSYADGEVLCDEYAYNYYIDSWTPERAAQLIMATI